MTPSLLLLIWDYASFPTKVFKPARFTSPPTEPALLIPNYYVEVFLKINLALPEVYLLGLFACPSLFLAVITG